MQSAAVRFGFVHGVFEGGHREEALGQLAGAVNAYQVLVDNASGANVGMPNFRVSHLSFGQTHGVAGGEEVGVRVLLPKPVYFRRARCGNGVEFTLRSNAPSIQNNQENTVFGSHGPILTQGGKPADFICRVLNFPHSGAANTPEARHSRRADVVATSAVDGTQTLVATGFKGEGEGEGVFIKEVARIASIHAASKLTQHSRRATGAVGAAFSSAEGRNEKHVYGGCLAYAIAQNPVVAWAHALALLALGVCRTTVVAAPAVRAVGLYVHTVSLAQLVRR